MDALLKLPSPLFSRARTSGRFGDGSTDSPPPKCEGHFLFSSTHGDLTALLFHSTFTFHEPCIVLTACSHDPHLSRDLQSPVQVSPVNLGSKQKPGS